VPAYGTFANLTGRALNVAPADYRIAVLIYVGGWWTKPYWSESGRLTPISADGTWTCDITTGGVDETATRIAAYLVPKGYLPPIAGGDSVVPPEIVAQAVASIEVTRTASGATRVITFSGYEWTVKKSTNPVGPPASGNYFSDSPENVWVDLQGRLHLKITRRGGKWYCPEVICSRSLGYGTYRFTLESDIAALDKNVVLGMFTWDDDPTSAHREIDIEFSRWGQAGDPNSQYVVQPWDQAGHRYRFTCPSISGQSVHSLVWAAGSVTFTSTHGQTQLGSWIFDGAGVPTSGAEHPRINLWLLNGSSAPPSDEKEVEITVTGFEFES